MEYLYVIAASVPILAIRRCALIRRGFDTDAWYLGVGRYSAVATVALRLRR